MAIKIQILPLVLGHCMRKIKYRLTKNLESVTNTTSENGPDWYYEVDRDSKHLLITAGDSWTYGQTLDPKKRTRQIYGSLISKNKNADWINVGLCAESNLIIKDYVTLVYNNLCKSYNKITIIFTLTESTRDLHSLNFIKENYNEIKGKGWPAFENVVDTVTVANEFPRSHIVDVLELHLALQSCDNIKNTIATVEDITVQSINRSFAGTKIILARNFSSWSNINNATVKEIWTENTARNGNLAPYPNELCFATTPLGADRCIEYNDKFKRIKNFKLDFLSHMDKAISAIKWLDNSPYNSNSGSKHPLKKAHSWWAEHLQKYYDDR